MNTLGTKQTEMCIRVIENRQQFSLAEADGLDGAGLFDKLGLAVEEIRSSDYDQSRAQSSMREISTRVEKKRETLEGKMETIRRTLRSTGLSGLENKFLPTRNVTDQNLLTLSRTYGSDAFPIKADLIKRGLGADFINDLSVAAQEFDEALDDREKQLVKQKEATLQLEGKIEGAVRIVRELGVIICNVYTEDSSKVALWESVSHVEKVPRRARQKEDDGSQPAPPAQG